MVMSVAIVMEMPLMIVVVFPVIMPATALIRAPSAGQCGRQGESGQQDQKSTPGNSERLKRRMQVQREFSRARKQEYCGSPEEENRGVTQRRECCL